MILSGRSINFERSLYITNDDPVREVTEKIDGRTLKKVMANAVLVASIDSKAKQELTASLSEVDVTEQWVGRLYELRRNGTLIIVLNEPEFDTSLGYCIGICMNCSLSMRVSERIGVRTIELHYKRIL